MQIIKVSTGYNPRLFQAQIHRSLKRFSVLVCHRRFGKTVLAVNEIIDRALRCTLPDPRYAYIAPTYKQAKLIAWDYVKKYCGPIPGVNFNEAELRCDLPNGAKIRLLGADSPDSVRGIYLDYSVFDEVAQMPKKIWSEVVRPLLEDRRGGAMFIGTPKGHNFFHELYELSQTKDDWYSATFRASETGIFTQEQLESIKCDGMSEEEFAQEFECSFEAAIVGAYFGKLMSVAEAEGRITNVPWESAVPVHTYWDLGIDDQMVIWFVQYVGKERRVIDVYADSGGGLIQAAKTLQSKPYIYGSHNAPHDIKVRELGSGKSRLEVAASLGINFETVPNIGVQDGIEAVRNILPQCWFDRVKCGRGIEAMKQYRRDWNDKGGCFKSTPLHDWTSDYADGFRYFAVSNKPNSGGVDYYKLYRR
jgi:phage terminase large subunit